MSDNANLAHAGTDVCMLQGTLLVICAPLLNVEPASHTLSDHDNNYAAMSIEISLSMKECT